MTNETTPTENIIEALTEQGRAFLNKPENKNKPIPKLILLCLQHLTADTQISSFATSQEHLLTSRLKELTGSPSQPVGYQVKEISPGQQLFCLTPNFSEINRQANQIGTFQPPLVSFFSGENIVFATKDKYLSVRPEFNLLNIALKVIFDRDTNPNTQAVKAAFQLASQSPVQSSQSPFSPQV